MPLHYLEADVNLKNIKHSQFSCMGRNLFGAICSPSNCMSRFLDSGWVIRTQVWFYRLRSGFSGLRSGFPDSDPVYRTQVRFS